MSASDEDIELTFDELMAIADTSNRYICQHGVPLNKLCLKCAGLEKSTVEAPDAKEMP